MSNRVAAYRAIPGPVALILGVASVTAGLIAFTVLAAVLAVLVVVAVVLTPVYLIGRRDLHRRAQADQQAMMVPTIPTQEEP